MFHYIRLQWNILLSFVSFSNYQYICIVLINHKRFLLKSSYYEYISISIRNTIILHEEEVHWELLRSSFRLSTCKASLYALLYSMLQLSLQEHHNMHSTLSLPALCSRIWGLSSMSVTQYRRPRPLVALTGSRLTQKDRLSHAAGDAPLVCRLSLYLNAVLWM